MVKDLYDVYCAKNMNRALEEFDQEVKIKRAYEEYEDIINEQRRYEAASEREVWLREGPFEIEEAFRVLWGEWDEVPNLEERSAIKHSTRRKEKARRYLKRLKIYKERCGDDDITPSRLHFLQSHAIYGDGRKCPFQKERFSKQFRKYPHDYDYDF